MSAHSSAETSASNLDIKSLPYGRLNIQLNCSKCDMTFTRPNNRRRHEAICGKRQHPHSCVSCLKKFTRADNFKKHSKTCIAFDGLFANICDKCGMFCPNNLLSHEASCKNPLPAAPVQSSVQTLASVQSPAPVQPPAPSQSPALQPSESAQEPTSAKTCVKSFSLTGVCVLSVGGLAMVLILGFYLDTIRHILRSAPDSAKSHSAFIVSVYPVVGLVSYCASVVPRAQLIAEALTQGMFMTALYQLFCLVMAYGGGEAQLIKKVQPSQISLQVAPCCCWTCFSCLPTYIMNKKHLRVLRGLVLQLPIIQGLAYLALLVMWTEEQDLYQINYNYFQPVVVTSILLGMWGMIMTVKVTQETLKDYNIQGKFIVLQLVLLLAKFQALIARSIAMSNIFPCRNPITPTVYTNLIYNSAMLWEMVLLSACARMLYIKPLPESYPTDKNSNLPKQICTLQEKITITENHTINENNTSSDVQY